MGSCGQVAPYAILSQFPLSSDLYLDPDQVVSDEYKEEWSPHPVEVTPIELISGSKTIQGWAAGTPADSEDTLHFAELTGVRPMIEIYPLEKAAEAYARMMSGKARIPRRPHDVRRSGNTSEHGSTNSKRGVNDSSFLIIPLNPMLADFLPSTRDFCVCSIPGKGRSHGAPDFLSHNSDRWNLHLLQRSGAERRSHHPVAARSSIVVADVSAAADEACRRLPLGCPGLPAT
jgi:hypothetical protein